MGTWGGDINLYKLEQLMSHNIFFLFERSGNQLTSLGLAATVLDANQNIAPDQPPHVMLDIFSMAQIAPKVGVAGEGWCRSRRLFPKGRQ